ncbi:HepT-like ribonuclease domain-containing protein [uncultured Xylophilus sp.]|uniref:HepT-like ribonuclease domain-containing protein n=1 Tax=uncultured Xylophilus sp. TaxID=296832 RepID=UPI0025E75DC3|nr:HepT-like ribonuclease domain-containing protein [uncultured Xylophilus sp.]
MDRTPAHLADMLAFVRELRGFAAHHTAASFTADRILCLATEKLFINLGEAAGRIEPTVAVTLPGVPWRQIIGLRNILAHGYEQVTHEVLFRTIETELPGLEDVLSRHVAAQSPARPA